MKKFLFPAIVTVAAISGTIGYFNQPTNKQPNALVVANIEALSDKEVTDGSKEKIAKEVEEDIWLDDESLPGITIRYYKIVKTVDCYGEGSVDCKEDYDVDGPFTQYIKNNV